MKNLTFIALALAMTLGQSAFARNLGALDENQTPQQLIPADQIANILTQSESSSNLSEPRTTPEMRYRSNYNYGRGHGGYRNWYPNYYSSYYNPYYYGYYGSYYNPYYYYYPYSYHQNTRTDRSAVTERASTPVACFASDSLGNWYADADTLSNATTLQQNVNNECVSSGESCVQNLGCALISGD